MNTVPENPVPAPLLGVRFFITFAMMGILPLVAWDLLMRGGLGSGLDTVGHVEWSMAVFAAACALVAVFACLQPTGAPWRPLPILAVVGTYVPALLVWILLLLGYLAAARALGLDVPAQPALDYLAGRRFERPGFWVVVFAVAIAAPVAEEVVFRGYLQGALQQVLPRPAAITLAALVFGLAHGMAYALPITLLGALFGWLFAWRGSLLAPIAAHALHNGLTILVAVLWPESLDYLYRR